MYTLLLPALLMNGESIIYKVEGDKNEEREGAG
jgi:hypothetical protein